MSNTTASARSAAPASLTAGVREYLPPAGAKEAVGAAVMRLSLRVGLKPFLGPPWPVAVQRAALAIGSALMPQDRRAQVRSDRIAHLPVERVTPVGGPAPACAILYLHGGAFVAGSPRTHRSITRRLCALTGAQVLVPHYRRAPEAPFPAQIEDGVTAYRQLLAEGHRPEQLAIAGDSAGGHLTLMVTVALREAGLPLPAAMVMMSPAFSLHPLPNSTAYERESRDPMIRQAWGDVVEVCMKVPPDHRWANPMAQDLRGLPPALLQVGEDEVLYDNSTWYQAVASQVGTHSELEIYLKRWHVFQAHAGILPSADQALRRQADFLKRHWR